MSYEERLRIGLILQRKDIVSQSADRLIHRLSERTSKSATNRQSIEARNITGVMQVVG